MVATGLVLWTAKRRAKQAATENEKPAFGFRLVERLNVATIAGLPVAMAAFLWGNRLLPLALADRREWEIHLFFIAWALVLLFAIARPVHRAWIELFAAGAALLAVLPWVGVVMGLRESGGLTGFDIALWGLSLVLAGTAMRIGRSKRRVARL